MLALKSQYGKLLMLLLLYFVSLLIFFLLQSKHLLRWSLLIRFRDIVVLVEIDFS